VLSRCHYIYLFCVYRRHRFFQSLYELPTIKFQNFSVGVFSRALFFDVLFVFQAWNIRYLYSNCYYFYQIVLWRVATFISPKQSIRFIRIPIKSCLHHRCICLNMYHAFTLLDENSIPIVLLTPYPPLYTSAATALALESITLSYCLLESSTKMVIDKRGVKLE